MSDYTKRLLTESAAEYARRMRQYIILLVGVVQSEAGVGIDIEEVIAQLEWIEDLPDDAVRAGILDRQQKVIRIVERMSDPAKLDAVFEFAEETSWA